MEGYLWANQVPMTRFGAHVNEISGRVKQAALRCVQEAGRTVQYLQSSQDDKEQDNCFPWVAGWGRAQHLMDTQRHANWPEVLGKIALLCYKVA